MGAGHHHHHHHSHPHSHSSEVGQRSTRAILWGFSLNLLFTIVEICGGVFSGSMSVLANAVHDLGDSASLALALYFERFSQKKRDPDYSFGYRRFSLLSALISGMIILTGSILILREAIPRLFAPAAPHGNTMLGLAVLGLCFNAAAALKLSGGSTQNEKMLSWHFWEDTLGWMATLVAAALVKGKGWYLADPILAVGLSVFVIFNVVRELKATFRLFLQGTPSDFNEKSFVAKAKQLPHVVSLHDLHVWSLDGENHVLSLHVVVDQTARLTPPDPLPVIKRSVQELARSHQIQHVTIETEWSDEENCHANCDDPVKDTTHHEH